MDERLEDLQLAVQSLGKGWTLRFQHIGTIDEYLSQYVLVYDDGISNREILLGEATCTKDSTEEWLLDQIFFSLIVRGLSDYVKKN